MANQSQNRQSVVIANGFNASVRVNSMDPWTNVGRTKGDSSCILNYDKSEEIFSDGAVLQAVYTNMTLAASMELADLYQPGINILASGITEYVTTDALPVTTIPDQVIPVGWDARELYEVQLLTSITDSTPLKNVTVPVITSITHNAGVPQVLVEDQHYIIVRNPNTFSGWAIQLTGANMTDQPAPDSSITIVYGTNTPTEQETLYAGNSSQAATNFEFRLTYTDDSGLLIHDLHLPKCAINSGALQLGLKGVESGGVNTMPISFDASIASGLTAGRQLLSWSTAASGKL